MNHSENSVSRLILDKTAFDYNVMNSSTLKLSKISKNQGLSPKKEGAK